MPKGSFLDDTFEKLAELGVSTVKKTGQAVKQTISPTKLIEHVSGTLSESEQRKNKLEEESKKPNHTKLSFQELNKKYQDQDKQKQEALRQKLFQLVKGGEEKAIQEKEKKQKEKEQKLMYEEQDKKRQKQDKDRQAQADTAPRGKIRKSIFGKKKKKAMPTAAEIKPSVGKQ